MAQLLPFGAVLFGISLLCMADTPVAPPATPRQPVTEDFHGTQVIDPYRWLENAKDPAVQKWTEEQFRYARAMLDQNPDLPAIRQRVKELMTYQSPSYGGLIERGGKLFAIKSQPPKNQAFLITLESVDRPDSARVVLDPNVLNPKGTTAIDMYLPSHDGRLVAISLSEGGSEQGDLHVYEVDTGKELKDDMVPRVHGATAGGSVAWKADGSGFYYTRYPRRQERPPADMDFYQQLYFHKLGTPTDQDIYVLGKGLPRIAEVSVHMSEDGRYMLATVANGDGGEFEHFLLSPDGQWTQLSRFEDKVQAGAFGPDDALYLFSLQDAPRGKILRLDVKHPELSAARVIVPPGDAVIEGEANGLAGHGANFTVTANRLYVVDQTGGPSQIRVFDHDGRALSKVPVRGIASVSKPVPVGGDAVLFRVGTYLEPSAWFHFDPATGEIRRTALAQTSPVNFEDTEVIRDTATSKDGTKVPLTILMRKGTKLDGKNPTLLTGYGGFNISLQPDYGRIRRVWLDAGGIMAIANLRGGGEYGEEWHRAGSGVHKQNVFDDFIACAQYLIDHHYTNPDKLAIQGGSNGGLLVGAALVQRPELFRAVVAQVGIYDMLLHDRHPNGAFNIPEYGTARDPEQFRAIYAYSPYQHVQDGAGYPAVFLLSGANDGRVDPGNSRKMAARLQEASSAKRPILLRISKSGHGAGTALSERIEQQADIFGFLFDQLGMRLHD
jgi:prolyl oligopeptidase